MGGCLAFLGPGAPTPATNDAAVSDSDRAVLDMMVQRDTLVSQRKRFEKQITEEEAAAKSFVSKGRKEMAMLMLRKKKYHQKLFEQSIQQLMKLEELIGDVEMAHMQKETVQALATGVTTIKQINKEIGGADYVQQLMDEQEDAVAEIKEVSAALAGQGVSEDDEEALAEFARLQEEYAASQMAGLPSVQPAVVTPATVAPATVAPSSEAESAPLLRPAAAAPAQAERAGRAGRASAA